MFNPMELKIIKRLRAARDLGLRSCEVFGFGEVDAARDLVARGYVSGYFPIALNGGRVVVDGATKFWEK